MSKQIKGRRLPFVTIIGLALCVLIAFGAFAGGAVSAPQAGQEMPTPRSGPSVSGTPRVGETLNANSGQWLYADGLGCSSRPAEPCHITWQWQRCNAAASACGDIAGANTTSYTLTDADAGARIRVVQTLTKRDCNAHGHDCRDTASSQVSAPTNLVAPRAVASPQNTQLPAISGTPMEEETLTASTGTWSGPQPISMSFQWYRCDANGNNCVPIAGATGQAYKLTPADVGFRIRVTGTATNAGGSAFATSEPTAVVAPFGPTAQRRSITVDRVALPHRLIIDRLEFRPSVVRSRAPFTARFRISDTRGFRIEGALVQVVTVPFGLVRPAAEVETNNEGWATFTLQPTQRLQLGRGRSLVFFVRARKPGENPLAGVSTRRLVQVKLG
ncbi:MAG: hypothetical protein M3321_09220 [Actinomycetota bacterium]|nr:hypothetical protein [Actinomycetota bacterium]